MQGQRQTDPIAKVSCFILHPVDRRLLVFTHPDFPGAGTQVPAGTVEPDETAADAAVREAEEETGFAGYKVLRLLDRQTLVEVRHGRREVHDRWFFHLAPPVDLPEDWEHGEAHGAESGECWTRFRFFWLEVDTDPLPLTADHAEVLRRTLLT